MDNFRYGYFEFLNDPRIDETDLYNLALEMEDLYYDMHYIAMFNTARRFFECMLYGACNDYLKIDYVKNKDNENMSIFGTAKKCFHETNSQNLYYNKIDPFINSIQEYSHYDEDINNDNISITSIKKLFEGIRECCLWYFNDVMRITLKLPQYIPQDNTQETIQHKDENDKLQAKNNELNAQITELNAQITELNNQISELETKQTNVSENKKERIVVESKYKELMTFYKDKVKEYNSIIGTIEDCTEILNTNRALKEVNKAIRKQFSDLLNVVNYRINSTTEENVAEINKDAIKTENSEEEYNNNKLKQDIKAVILLFNEKGCYITLKTIFKYLIGKTENYTKCFNLQKTNGFGTYKANELSMFTVSEILSEYCNSSFIETNDNIYYNLLNKNK